MNYLIPANTNSGKLIFGMFKVEDLILFGIGITVTILLLAFVPVSSFWMSILMLSPAAISSFLVIPLPYYHNMLTFILDIYDFLESQREYKWKGWCNRNVKKQK